MMLIATRKARKLFCREKEADGNSSPVYGSTCIIETTASSVEPVPFLRRSSKAALDGCTSEITWAQITQKLGHGTFICLSLPNCWFGVCKHLWKLEELQQDTIWAIKSEEQKKICGKICSFFFVKWLYFKLYFTFQSFKIMALNICKILNVFTNISEERITASERLRDSCTVSCKELHYKEENWQKSSQRCLPVFACCRFEIQYSHISNV